MSSRHAPTEPTPGLPVHAFNAPHRSIGPVPARSRVPKSPRLQGAIALHPLPNSAGGVAILEPFWERPAGTQTHSRRTEQKLGRLRYARQELVRLSESNTKYGGQRGITGVDAAPVIEPSISESKGIPKRKKLLPQGRIRLRPAVHRELFF